MTNPTCRVCDGEGWVCEEHGSHAMNACPSALILGAPCTCNPDENPPPNFEIVNVDLVREEAAGAAH